MVDASCAYYSMCLVFFVEGHPLAVIPWVPSRATTMPCDLSALPPIELAICAKHWLPTWQGFGAKSEVVI
jgi:hypothetical protein